MWPGLALNLPDAVIVGIYPHAWLGSFHMDCPFCLFWLIYFSGSLNVIIKVSPQDGDYYCCFILAEPGLKTRLLLSSAISQMIALSSLQSICLPLHAQLLTSWVSTKSSEDTSKQRRIQSMGVKTVTDEVLDHRK